MIGARCPSVNDCGMTARPPPGSRPRAMMAASISTSLRTGAGIGMTLSDRAVSTIRGRNAKVAVVSELNMIATRLSPGAISESNSSHLPTSAGSKLAKPVILPPGWLSRGTMPMATGSPTFAKTIGIVRVCRWRAMVAPNPIARIIVGLQAAQLLRKRLYPIGVTAAPPKVHPHVVAHGPAQVRKRLREGRVEELPLWIIFVERHEHANPPHALSLLRVCRQRPRRCRPAERNHEFSPFNVDCHEAFP